MFTNQVEMVDKLATTGFVTADFVLLLAWSEDLHPPRPLGRTKTSWCKVFQKGCKVSITMATTVCHWRKLM